MAKKKPINFSAIVPGPMPTDWRFIDLTDRTFGRLYVVRFYGSHHLNDRWYHYWECRCKCDCATVVYVRGSHLLDGNTTSCGCYAREQVSAAATQHGDTVNGRRSREHAIWTGMLDRCYNKNAPAYASYGVLGITVCDRWRYSYAAFLEDMGRCPKGLTIDRFPDNDGNYCPENCRWATMKEQSRNRRTNRLITFNGETLCVAEWAERFGMSRNVLLVRLKKNWSIERALTEPCGWSLSPGRLDRKKRKNNRLVTFNGETLCVAAWSERLGMRQGVLLSRLKKWSVERALTEPIHAEKSRYCKG